MCKPDFVDCIELSPSLGEVDAFSVLQSIISKVDECEVLEVETTVSGGRRGGEEGEGEGEGEEGEGRMGKGRD